MSFTQFGPSCEPSVMLFEGFGGVLLPEPTHDRCPGSESLPGLIGGWTCPCECHRRPAPHLLWKQAEAEHPDDIDALRRRYRALMIEHGHLVPGKPKPLPCGRRPATTAPSGGAS